MWSKSRWCWYATRKCLVRTFTKIPHKDWKRESRWPEKAVNGGPFRWRASQEKNKGKETWAKWNNISDKLKNNMRIQSPAQQGRHCGAEYHCESPLFWAALSRWRDHSCNSEARAFLQNMEGELGGSRHRTIHSCNKGSRIGQRTNKDHKGINQATTKHQVGKGLACLHISMCST